MKYKCTYCGQESKKTLCEDCREDLLDAVEDNEKSDYDIYLEENKRGTL